MIETSLALTHQISGEDAFRLKDTYGLPLDEILLLAKDQDLSVDIAGFDKLEDQAKERSRQARKKEAQGYEEQIFESILARCGPSSFQGYNLLRNQGHIVALLKDNQLVDKLQEGDQGIIILDQTPFYAEKGGQIGDRGSIFGQESTFDVLDCQTPFNGLIAHVGRVSKGSFSPGEKIIANVDSAFRKRITHYHTATHLLHLALNQVLGPHVRQAGSLVSHERLRFDFSHPKPLTSDELWKIEERVNQLITDNIEVSTYEVPFAEIQKKAEVKQFFGEKYGAQVRVVDIEESKELCGGTHAKHTGEIGLFKITKEGALAAGTRRIEAVCGHEALLEIKAMRDLIANLASSLKVQESQLKEKIHHLIEEQKAQEIRLEELKSKILQAQVDEWKKQVICVNHHFYLIKTVNLDQKDLKTAGTLLLKSGMGALFLISLHEGRLFFWALMSEKLVQKGLSAADWLKLILELSSGKGGGKMEAAQGSSSQQINPLVIEAKAKEWIETHLIA